MLRKVNDIYVTEAITFPRCGHTWLSRILKYYFKNSLNYCEKYFDSDNIIDLNQNTNLQKNHDFDLLTEIKNDRKYLIQIRNRDECLNSAFKLDFFKHDKNFNNINTDINDGTFTTREFIDTYGISYCDWVISKREYYSSFVKKWIESSVPNSKVINYEKLKSDTLSECASVIKFLTDNDCNEVRLLNAILYSNKKHTSLFEYENEVI